MRSLHGIIIALVVTTLVYIPALSGEFLALDDELLVLDNPTVHGFNLSNTWKAFSSYDPELYIPLTLLTYQVEWSLVGDAPFLYHCTNLFLHLLATLFVFLILRRFFSLQLTLVCVLLFSLHPLQVEAVAWVSGRKDLLASMFFLASVLGYLRWKEGSGRYATGVILFLMGLLSKVSIFPLPVCLVLLDYLQCDRVSRRSVFQKWPYFLLSILFVIIAFYGKQAQSAGLWVSTLLAFVAIPFSLWHAVYPVGLSVFYPFIDPVTVTHPQVLFGVVFLVAVLLIAWFMRTRARVVLFAILWFLLLLEPSFLNAQKGGELGIPDLYITSDRYMYLALLGSLFVVGYALKRFRWYWGILPVLLFGVLTARTIPHWSTSRALFHNVIYSGQPSHVAYTNYAGFVALDGDLARAEKLYEHSLQIRTTTRALFNLAQIQRARGKSYDAVQTLNQLLKLRPDDQEARELMQRLE